MLRPLPYCLKIFLYFHFYCTAPLAVRLGPTPLPSVSSLDMSATIHFNDRMYGTKVAKKKNHCWYIFIHATILESTIVFILYMHCFMCRQIHTWQWHSLASMTTECHATLNTIEDQSWITAWYWYCSSQKQLDGLVRKRWKIRSIYIPHTAIEICQKCVIGCDKTEVATVIIIKYTLYLTNL